MLELLSIATGILIVLGRTTILSYRIFIQKPVPVNKNVVDANTISSFKGRFFVTTTWLPRKQFPLHALANDKTVNVDYY